MVSLFTEVPAGQATDVILFKLELDEGLEMKTTLSREQICHFIKVCLQITCFLYGESYYEKEEGVAIMGSPLSESILSITETMKM